MRVDSHLRVKTTKVLSDVFFSLLLSEVAVRKKVFFFYIFLAANFSCRQFPTRMRMKSPMKFVLKHPVVESLLVIQDVVKEIYEFPS